MVFGEHINFDLENNPIEIKTETESTAGSDKKLYLVFFGGGTAGGLYIYFKSPLEYRLHQCTGDKEFPDNLPAETSKIWRITLSKTSGNKRLVVHCNGIEVVDVVISDTTCSEPTSTWSSTWNKDVVEFKFDNGGATPIKYRGNFQEK